MDYQKFIKSKYVLFGGCTIVYWLLVNKRNRNQTMKLYPVFLNLKGVFAKNERGYRLNAIKKRF